MTNDMREFHKRIVKRYAEYQYQLGVDTTNGCNTELLQLRVRLFYRAICALIDRGIVTYHNMKTDEFTDEQIDIVLKELGNIYYSFDD